MFLKIIAVGSNTQLQIVAVANCHSCNDMQLQCVAVAMCCSCNKMQMQ